MTRMKQYSPLSMIVMIVAVVAVGVGIFFMVQGVTKTGWMQEAMRLEEVTLGLDETALANGELVDSSGELQASGDILREHRRSIAATYAELLEHSGGRYNASHIEDLTYTQALNMENYLYLGVLGFGVADMALGIGAFMLASGIAFGAISFALPKRK